MPSVCRREALSCELPSVCRREALQLTDGIDSPGGVCIHLLISLGFCWVVVYFCTFRGVRWSGKVRWSVGLLISLVVTVCSQGLLISLVVRVS